MQDEKKCMDLILICVVIIELLLLIITELVKKKLNQIQSQSRQ